MITLKNISIRRGSRLLLDNVNWTIFAKQRIGLIGANGSGKSSLFSMLLGKLATDTGELEIPRQLRLAHVAQETPALQHSALDFVLDGDQSLRAIQTKMQQAEQDNDGILIAEMHEKLSVIDGYTATARASQLLAGLGFSTEAHSKNVADFSGGWRVRLNLAQALMTPSDVLLLDEPTNHLDLDAILWLEQWLRNYPGTLIVISHDRNFLDNSVDHIAKIERANIKTYTGNYASYEAQRASELLLQQAVYEKQQRQLAHMKSFVERFRYKASKARQAQSRLKAIERLELVSAVQSESEFHFKFYEPESSPSVLITLNHVNVGYDANVIVNNLNFSVTPKERLAILGPNGAGKSTLIKTLAQQLKPISGECIFASSLRIGYFDQQQVDRLDLEASSLLHLQRIAPNATELDLRKYLGGFGFSGDRVHEPVNTFSGGEKTRLALALLIWQKPNLLLLDEPTNHLDLDMRNALSLALTEYSGAMILISHDRFLVNSTTDKLMLCAGGRLSEFDGDLTDYQNWLIEYNKDKAQPERNNNDSKKELRREAAKQRERLKPLNDKIKKLEKEIIKLQTKAAKYEEALTDQDMYLPENKDQLKELLLSVSETKSMLEKLEDDWLESCEERDMLAE